MSIFISTEHLLKKTEGNRNNDIHVKTFPVARKRLWLPGRISILHIFLPLILHNHTKKTSISSGYPTYCEQSSGVPRIIL